MIINFFVAIGKVVFSFLIHISNIFRLTLVKFFFIDIMVLFDISTSIGRISHIILFSSIKLFFRYKTRFLTNVNKR